MRVQCKFLECRRGSRIVGRHAKAIVTISKGTIASEYKLQIVYQQKEKKNSKYVINSQSPPSILIHGNKLTLRLRDSPMDLFLDFFETPPPQARNLIDALHAICRGEDIELKPQVEKVKSTDFVAYQSEMQVVLRSDYPQLAATFPNTLTQLTIGGIGLSAVDSRWFQLTNLQCLTITDNPRLGASRNFEKFHHIERLQQLQAFTIQRCNLGLVGFSKLPYLTMSLPKSVIRLDLSDNGLLEFPLLSAITRHNLRYLHLSNNKIQQFPRDLTLTSFSSLSDLRVDRNAIRHVPGSLLTFRLETFYIDDNPATNENLHEDALLACSWNNVLAHYDREHTVQCHEHIGARETLVEKAARTLINSCDKSIALQFCRLPVDVRLRLHNGAYICFKCSKKIFYRAVVESKILVRQFASLTDAPLSRVRARSHYCLDCVPCRLRH